MTDWQIIESRKRIEEQRRKAYEAEVKYERLKQHLAFGTAVIMEQYKYDMLSAFYQSLNPNLNKPKSLNTRARIKAFLIRLIDLI